MSVICPRLEQQAQDLVQARDQAVQLGRLHTELKTQLEAQKDRVALNVRKYPEAAQQVSYGS